MDTMHLTYLQHLQKKLLLFVVGVLIDMKRPKGQWMRVIYKGDVQHVQPKKGLRTDVVSILRFAV